VELGPFEKITFFPTDPLAVNTNNKQQSTKSGSGRLGSGGSIDTRTTAATTADGTMALIAATRRLQWQW